ncbi:hypothetical protein GS4_16_00280 [Gordonia soli NBRC 108243]|uniref:Uncharacterized protein n=1 Tax=Gordonia soli NBRC 108243 TaxID=1223545 RepID=M0QIW2_9ACTN|nr:hypothetical protein GS4_16_00280 [Gordonia soli NBRC 108243]
MAELDHGRGSTGPSKPNKLRLNVGEIVTGGIENPQLEDLRDLCRDTELLQRRHLRGGLSGQLHPPGAG